jgi:hypothetical protein
MSPMRRRLASLLVAVTLLALGSASAASADGDPASDILLGQSVFYPYQPAVSAALQRRLNAEATAAANAGLRIKVAIIGAPIDLGAIEQLFGKPQEYAEFLDREISFTGPQPLLVVMAAGYGAQALPAPAQAALSSLAPPLGKSNDDLTRAALTAVSRLAAADGHPIVTRPDTVTTSARSPLPLLAALIAGALLAAGGVIALRRRGGQLGN